MKHIQSGLSQVSDNLRKIFNWKTNIFITSSRMAFKNVYLQFFSWEICMPLWNQQAQVPQRQRKMVSKKKSIVSVCIKVSYIIAMEKVINALITSRKFLFIFDLFDFSRIDKQNLTPYFSVMYPLSPNLELDMEEDEKDEDDDIIGKHSVAMKSTRLQASSYSEKSGHIKALSS